jgi:hypothetical protein
MRIRPWHYLMELHHHDNANCTKPRPLPGRGLMIVRGTGDRPLCDECARLNAEFSAQQLGQLAGTLQPDAPVEQDPEQASAEQADVDIAKSRKDI